MESPGSILTFEAGHQCWALPMSRVRELLHFAQLCSPPERPRHLEGFLDVAGEQVAVINFAELVDLPRIPINLYTPLILLKDVSLALLVAQLGNLIRPAVDSMLTVEPDMVVNNFVQAVFSKDGMKVQLLDCDRLLLTEERRRIEDLQRQHQKRLGRLKAE